MSSEAERAALVGALERVGDRWTLLVIHALLGGPARFGELEDVVEGISPNILSQRLKQLEADGLVVATLYEQRPPRYRYELTARGTGLADALAALAQWGGEVTGGEAVVRHEACGTAAEVRWWCPTCEREVEDETTHLAHL